ncbi:hypothetical protein OE88DRAFT_1366615 [Heliocybe sulcata]|uniref:Uncharacterized protein n=1 Tax=Heliocybe sulcata TaxID=5364 RepID=A0A5C3N8B9_9AGAM|nr:hypothetical protein OE88DRAFT_1366615 [Heliocybe sulcata]
MSEPTTFQSGSSMTTHLAQDPLRRNLSPVPSPRRSTNEGRILLVDPRGRKLYLCLDLCDQFELREKLWLWYSDFPEDQDRIRRWEWKLVAYDNPSPDLESSDSECVLEDGVSVRIVWLPPWLGFDDFRPLSFIPKWRRPNQPTSTAENREDTSSLNVDSLHSYAHMEAGAAGRSAG